MKFTLVHALLFSTANTIKLGDSFAMLYDKALADSCNLQVTNSLVQSFPESDTTRDSSLIATSSQVSSGLIESHCFITKGQNSDPRKSCIIASGIKYQIESKNGQIFMQKSGCKTGVQSTNFADAEMYHDSPQTYWTFNPTSAN